MNGAGSKIGRGCSLIIITETLNRKKSKLSVYHRIRVQITIYDKTGGRK